MTRWPGAARGRKLALAAARGAGWRQGAAAVAREQRRAAVAAGSGERRWQVEERGGRLRLLKGGEADLGRGSGGGGSDSLPESGLGTAARGERGATSDILRIPETIFTIQT